jgi:hypothetical protein
MFAQRDEDERRDDDRGAAARNKQAMFPQRRARFATSHHLV